MFSKREVVIMNTRSGLQIHRRQFLQTAATVGCGLSLSAFGQVDLPQAGTVGDKLWLFSNPTNADYGLLRKRSVMSPFEAAVYMGIPNIFMVQQYPGKGEESWYKPFEPPFEQYMVPLSMLKRIAWSIVGAAGVTKEWERKQVMTMALHTPNMVGLYMDDFFKEESAASPASFTLEELRAIKQQLKGSRKKLELYVTFYAQFLDRPFGEYLKLIDVITLWSSKPEDVANLGTNLARLEKLAPNSRKMVGLYTTDYDAKRTPAWVGMAVPAMRQQCEQALSCLRSGQIEGIVIYGGTTFDLGFEAVEWTRKWIRRVGPTKL